MTKQMSEDKIHELARKRVKAKRDFYGDFVAWLTVNIVLVIVWALTGRGHMWFLWPLCIWGFFIAIHFFRAFVFKEQSDEEAVEKEAEKLRKERN